MPMWWLLGGLALRHALSANTLARCTWWHLALTLIIICNADANPNPNAKPNIHMPAAHGVTWPSEDQ